MGLITEVGRKEVIGKPILYGTTDRFLTTFGFNTLADLPDIPDEILEQKLFPEEGEEVLELESSEDARKKMNTRLGKNPSRKHRIGQQMEEKLERLQKVMAAAGIASRRECEKMIQAGRVQVNGKTVTELGTKVGPKASSPLTARACGLRKTVYSPVQAPGRGDHHEGSPGPPDGG